jgi:hypothetical protein
MSSPGLTQGVMAADAVTSALAESSATKTVACDTSAALTARAVLVVTLAGAGFWYFLWKIALYFIERH